MIRFNSDYMEGCHPLILKRLTETNFEKRVGYGYDDLCQSAREKICAACDAPDAKVFFLVGGTQTNAFVIDAVLDACDGVLCVDSGHISGPEAGAVECWGHKVLTIPAQDGKITAQGIKKYCNDFYADRYHYSHCHMVAPGMVYISHPTEIGTIYTKSELTAIKRVCEEFNLALFIDGARLGYGIVAEGSDLTLPDIAKLCDVFYIGGTKVGAMFGEAVVVTNHNLIKKPIPLIKRHGALLAKGWLLGMQFDTLFTDNLYLNISKNAVDCAMRMRREFNNRGYRCYVDSPTNQQFVILPNDVLNYIKPNVDYTFWEHYDECNTVVRLVTSWATTQEQIDELISYLPR